MQAFFLLANILTVMEALAVPPLNYSTFVCWLKSTLLTLPELPGLIYHFFFLIIKKLGN